MLSRSSIAASQIGMNALNIARACRRALFISAYSGGGRNRAMFASESSVARSSAIPRSVFTASDFGMDRSQCDIAMRNKIAAGVGVGRSSGFVGSSNADTDANSHGLNSTQRRFIARKGFAKVDYERGINGALSCPFRAIALGRQVSPNSAFQSQLVACPDQMTDRTAVLSGARG